MFRLNSPAKRLLFVIGVLVLVGLILRAIDRKTDTNTGDLRITILDNDTKRFIRKEEIQKTIIDTFQHNLSGIPIGSMDVKRIEKVLQNNPFIETADVYIDATNHVNVKITQREPIVRIADMEGSNYYIDNKGRYMPTSRHFAARVPVASGFINNRDYNTPIEDVRNPLNGLFILVKYIQNDALLNAQIEQIYIDKNGEFTLVPKVGNQKIIFGDINDIAAKFKRLKIFYREAIPYEGWTKYKTINVKYEGQVVCGK